MLRHVSLILSIAFVTLSSVPAASQSAPTYSPWTKFCIGERCFVGSDLRTECGPLFAAVLIETARGSKEILRVTLPTSVNTAHGVRIAIDQVNPVTRPFASCPANGCMADYEAGAELVDRLKQGHALTLSAVNSDNSPISLSLPLAGFAAAYDGPPQSPKIFEVQSGKLQEELRAAHEDERKVHCGAK